MSATTPASPLGLCVSTLRLAGGIMLHPASPPIVGGGARFGQARGGCLDRSLGGLVKDAQRGRLAARAVVRPQSLTRHTRVARQGHD